MDEASLDGNELSSGAQRDEHDEPIGHRDLPTGEEPLKASDGRDDRGDPEETEAPGTFLERLDRRQNQVLKELDQLNARIEQVVEGFRRA